MYLNDGGYSGVQYSNELLRTTAKRIAERLPSIMERTGAQAVAVTGKSGMSLAFATQMFLDFPIIVVRKRGENSHGNPVEGTGGLDVSKYLILDDFVASGNTVRSIVDILHEQYHRGGHSDESEPVCVGVVEYSCYKNHETVRLDNGHRVPIFTA